MDLYVNNVTQISVTFDTFPWSQLVQGMQGYLYITFFSYIMKLRIYSLTSELSRKDQNISVTWTEIYFRMFLHLNFTLKSHKIKTAFTLNF